MRRLPIVGLAILAVVVCTHGPRAQTGSRLFPEASTGPLVIIGGSIDPGNEPVYRAILGLTLEGRPLCVLPTASNQPDRAMNDTVAVFERYGGPETAIGVPLLYSKPSRADKTKFAQRIEACGGFFFTDGEAARIVDTLRPRGRSTLVEQAILRVHRRGGVIAGSAAGAAMMSDPMIGSGSSEDALLHGAVGDDDDPGVWVRGGMGFFRGGLTDQHHLAQGRTGRLLVALASLDEVARGFGIDDDTALIVQGTEARVVGDSQVVVLEETLKGKGPVFLDGAKFRVLLLGNGDSIDLVSAEAFVEARKEILRLERDPPVAPSGVWLETGLHQFVVDLAVSRASSAEFATQGYRFRLTKEQGFDARAWEIPDRSQVPHGFTAGWFGLDIRSDPGGGP